jgi:murein DD-endopeptidase MepM/ murein hydrolase activator NlpD
LKDKFIITISDIHGSRQYTLNQFIKVFLIWLVIGIVMLFAIGMVIVDNLHNRVDILNGEKEILKDQIDQKSETLLALDEQLQEAKELIGLKDEQIEYSDKRVEELKDKMKVKQGYKRELSDIEYKYISRVIPNGKPVEFSRISSGFGFRKHPISKKKKFHSALDLVTNMDTKVFSPADGVVIYAGNKKYYGNFLHIRHGLGFSTAYGHLNHISVRNGEYVKKGDLIALSGNSGRSTGPHLHYEIRYLGKWIDPIYFLNWSKRDYGLVMEKSKIVFWDGLIQNVREKLKIKGE